MDTHKDKATNPRTEAEAERVESLNELSGTQRRTSEYGDAKPKLDETPAEEHRGGPLPDMKR